MDRKLAAVIQFVATAVAAAIAALVVAASAASAADSAWIAAGGAPATGAAHAQQADAGFAQALKVRYLSCEQAAGAAVRDGAAVMACSIVFEELKHRVFGGSFDALLAWWRDARREAWRGGQAGPRAVLG